jgi:hypothetical protein
MHPKATGLIGVAGIKFNRKFTQNTRTIKNILIRYIQTLFYETDFNQKLFKSFKISPSHTTFSILQ